MYLLNKTKATLYIFADTTNVDEKLNTTDSYELINISKYNR